MKKDAFVYGKTVCRALRWLARDVSAKYRSAKKREAVSLDASEKNMPPGVRRGENESGQTAKLVFLPTGHSE